MLKYIKQRFYNKKLNNLKIKHERLLKESKSMNNHHHNHESEEIFKKIHDIEKKIEKIEKIVDNV